MDSEVSLRKDSVVGFSSFFTLCECKVITPLAIPSHDSTGIGPIPAHPSITACRILEEDSLTVGFVKGMFGFEGEINKSIHLN